MLFLSQYRPKYERWSDLHQHSGDALVGWRAHGLRNRSFWNGCREEDWIQPDQQIERQADPDGGNIPVRIDTHSRTVHSPGSQCEYSTGYGIRVGSYNDFSVVVLSWPQTIGSPSKLKIGSDPPNWLSSKVCPKVWLVLVRFLHECGAPYISMQSAHQASFVGPIAPVPSTPTARRGRLTAQLLFQQTKQLITATTKYNLACEGDMNAPKFSR